MHLGVACSTACRRYNVSDVIRGTQRARHVGYMALMLSNSLVLRVSGISQERTYLEKKKRPVNQDESHLLLLLRR
jgi:hypothetical protein